METERPYRRFASVSRSHVWHLEFADVHARIRTAGKHSASTLVHADHARIHRSAVGLRADAGWVHDHAAVAAGRVLAVAVYAAVAAGIRLGCALDFVVFHDAIQSGNRFPDSRDRPPDASSRHGIPLRSNQHGSLFLSPAG